MNIFARIVTDDERLERMLSLELSACGITIITYSDEQSDGEIFTILDIDFYGEDISELSSDSKVIGFSRYDRSELSKPGGKYIAVLHRPFLMSELFSLIFEHEELCVSSQKAAENRYGKISFQEKKKRLSLDCDRRCALLGNDIISLTDSEYNILSCLYKMRGKTVTRDELSAQLTSGDGNNCEVYICMLRRKIDNRYGMKFIYTVRSKGYMLK